MGETYCGKDCNECTRRESLGCPGCKNGPGGGYPIECEVAKCCWEKGHEDCDTCSMKTSCSMWSRRKKLPEERLQKRAADSEKQAEIARRAPFLGRWIWVLFWLVIAATAAGIMAGKTIGGWVPALRFAGEILDTLCMAAYGLALLQLSAENGHYRISGICSLTATVVSAIAIWVIGGSDTVWSLFLTLPAAVLVVVGEYQEYTGHAEVLFDADYAQSEKWRKLWRWYIGAFAAMWVGVIVMLIIPLLGSLIVLASSVITLVVSVLKLVYLYRTATLFRRYPKTEA